MRRGLRKGHIGRCWVVVTHGRHEQQPPQAQPSTIAAYAAIVLNYLSAGEGGCTRRAAVGAVGARIAHPRNGFFVKRANNFQFVRLSKARLTLLIMEGSRPKDGFDSGAKRRETRQCERARFWGGIAIATGFCRRPARCTGSPGRCTRCTVLLTPAARSSKTGCRCREGRPLLPYPAPRRMPCRKRPCPGPGTEAVAALKGGTRRARVQHMVSTWSA